MHTPTDLPPAPRAARAALPWLLLGGFLVVRAALLVRWDLWYDELFGVGLAYLDWPAMLRRVAADQTNPPLFYALVKLWVGAGGDGIAWLRLLPFGAASLGLFPLLRLTARARLSPAARLATLALVAASPLLCFYSVEVRAYALLGTLATAATLETLTVVLEDGATRGTVWRLAAWNALLVLTHYFGWFVIAAEWSALLLFRRDRWRLLLPVTLPAIALFTPWALWVARSARAAGTLAPTIAWIPRPGVRAVLEYPAFLFSAAAPAIALATGVVALTCIVAALANPSEGRAERRGTWVLALFVVVPVILAFGASWALPKSIWAPRYLIGSAVPACALVALGLERFGKRALAVGTTAFVAMALTGLVTARDAKTHWVGLVDRLADPAARPLTVYAFEAYTALPLQYYTSLDARGLTLSGIALPAQITAPEGWVVARLGAWPGDTRGADALREWGLTVVDSTESGAPEHIRAWRYRR